MAFNVDASYDITIAYYGDTTSGSSQAAHEIYRHLSQNGIKAFIRHADHPHEASQDALEAASGARLFLWVIDHHVPTDAQGRLASAESDDAKRLLQEINAFQKGNSFQQYGHLVTGIFLCPDIPPADYDKYTSLHTVFAGNPCLHKSDHSDVDQWVSGALSLLDSDRSAPSSGGKGSEIAFYKKYLQLARSNTKPADTTSPEEDKAD